RMPNTKSIWLRSLGRTGDLTGRLGLSDIPPTVAQLKNSSQGHILAYLTRWRSPPTIEPSPPLLAYELRSDPSGHRRATRSPEFGAPRPRQRSRSPLSPGA